MFRINVFILLLPLLSCGCWAGWVGPMLMAGGSLGPPPCPDAPSVAWMVPTIEIQPDQLSYRQMSVQGAYAPKAEIIGRDSTKHLGGIISFHEPEECWTKTGLPLDTLTEAVSTALANAGLVQFVAIPEGKYMLQFEVERQRVTPEFHYPGLGGATATVVVSYSVSVSDSKAQIWKEEITGEHTIKMGVFAPRRNYGSKDPTTAAMEGAVAENLRVLINKLRELQLDKDRAAGFEPTRVTVR